MSQLSEYENLEHWADEGVSEALAVDLMVTFGYPDTPQRRWYLVRGDISRLVNPILSPFSKGKG